jgi:outer membrane protein
MLVNKMNDRKMKAKKWIFISFILLAFVLQINATQGQTNLQNLVNYALVHSREVKKSNLQVEEAQYKYRETLGQGLPQIDAKGTYSKMTLPDITIPESIISMIPEKYAPMLAQLGNIDGLYTASAGITVSQLLYSQSYLTGLKTTQKAQEMYKLLKNKTEEEVIEEVANSFYQTLLLGQQLKTIDNSLINLKEIYRIVELNYRNDLVKESNVSRLKVTITNLEVNQQTIKNVVDIQVNYIKALAGMPADTALVLDTANIVPAINSMSLEQNFLVGNVAAFQVLQKQSELNNQEIKLAQAKFLPTVAAFAQFNFSSYNTKAEINQFSNMNTFGVQLTIPVFTSGVNAAKIKQAQLKKAQTDETILKTKDLLTVSYSNALSEYQTAIKLLDAQKDNRELALKVYNQTASQYKEGMASMADLLNVNSDYIQAENSYNQQILKCKLAEVKMLKSSGNLKQLVNNK